MVDDGTLQKDSYADTALGVGYGFIVVAAAKSK